MWRLILDSPILWVNIVDIGVSSNSSWKISTTTWLGRQRNQERYDVAPQIPHYY